MKIISKQTFCLAIAVILSFGAASLAQAGVNWNVNVDIGIPTAQVPAPPPPPPPQTVMLPPQPPPFVYVPELGYYVASGVPFDLVYVNRMYFHFRDGHWYQAEQYGAPWRYTPVERLPPLMRRHSYNEYRNHRDAELSRYKSEREYRGDFHQPRGNAYGHDKKYKDDQRDNDQGDHGGGEHGHGHGNK